MIGAQAEQSSMVSSDHTSDTAQPTHPSVQVASDSTQPAHPSTQAVSGSSQPTPQSNYARFFVNDTEGRLLCKHCDCTFTDVNELLFHAEDCSKSRCEFCNRSFASEQEVITHKLVCSNNTLQCGKCLNKFLTVEILKNHSFLCSLHTCCHCNKSFNCAENLSKHWKLCLKKSALEKFSCPICGTGFTRNSSLKRHKCKSQAGPSTEFRCRYCKTMFTRSDNLGRHELKCKDRFTCSYCGKLFNTKRVLINHLNLCFESICPKCDQKFSTLTDLNIHSKHCVFVKCSKCRTPFEGGEECRLHEVDCRGNRVNNPLMRKQYRINCIPNRDGLIVVREFGDRLADLYFKNVNGLLLVEDFLHDREQLFINSITDYLNVWDNLKISCLLEIMYVKFLYYSPDVTPLDESETLHANFKTSTFSVTRTSNLKSLYGDIKTKLLEEMDEFHLKGSGWIVRHIDGLMLMLSKHRPLSGNSYIPLHKKLKNKKSIINVQNRDNHCFYYAILSKFVKDNPHRPRSYKNLNHNFSFDKIKYPASLTDIKRFEENNNSTVHLFGLNDNGQLFPLRIGKKRQGGHVFDLLYLENEHTDNTHYCLIKHLSRLVRSQVTKYEHKHLFCRNCFTHYPVNRFYVNGESAGERYAKHIQLCSDNAPAVCQLPPPKSKLVFDKFYQGDRKPVIIYADFEAIQTPIEGALRGVGVKTWSTSSGEGCEGSWSFSKTRHTACGAGLYVHSELRDLSSYYYSHMGEDCVEKFLSHLHKLSSQIDRIFTNPEPMTPLSEDQKLAYDRASVCGICGKGPFVVEPKGNPLEKVADHCHFRLSNNTGSNYRQPAHRLCNLQYRKTRDVNIVFHNANYDLSFILQELGKFYPNSESKVLANSSEKFICFTFRFSRKQIIYFKIIDSFRFLSTSLETLAANLTDYPFIDSHFTDPGKAALLKRKGFLPYSYLDSWEKLSETSLPPRHAFTNDLTQREIGQTDYEHACSVWSTFNIQTLQDYISLYMMTDILLTGCVFESFRSLALTTYLIDPAHFVSAPSLSYNAMIRRLKQDIDFVTDIDMYMFFEASVRGGITNVVERSSQSNLPGTSNYDPTQDTAYLIYIDFCNLYGWGLSRRLPMSNYRWVNEAEKKLDLFLSTEETSDWGFTVEIDFSYPDSCHDRLNLMPPAAERKKLGHTVKLVNSLEPKVNYVCHYMVLKQLVGLGARIDRVHRAVTYRQGDFLKDYIDLNSKLRVEARDKFSKDFYKLMNNSLFGFLLKNNRNRRTIDLVTDPKRLDRLVRKPNFADRHIINEHAVLVSRRAEKILLDSLPSIGATVLDRSKTHFFEFLYDVMVNKFGDRLKLLYCDTDSFIMRIVSHDVYDELKDLDRHFDFSNLDKTHRLYSETNKSVPGFMKDELAGQTMTHFLALQPKLYAYRLESGEVSKKCRGIPHSVFQTNVTFEDNQRALYGEDRLYITSSSIRSYNRQMYTVVNRKSCLSKFNFNKRVLNEDGISSTALGHYRLRKEV